MSDRAKATLARVSSACFDGVYLADWEDSICWDDIAQSGEQIDSEQESDDEGQHAIPACMTPSRHQEINQFHLSLVA